MSDTCLDIGVILGRYAAQAEPALTTQQRRVIDDLSACRTPLLGGRIEQCSRCGAREYLYNSCRNRHCPKCQGGYRAAWLDREAGYLLAVEYHHLVFTLPQAVGELARDNPRLIYSLLFEASSRSVQEVAAKARHLGAQVGLTAVLHTWGQTLSLHPHLHIMATGGGLSCNSRGQIDEQPVWRSCRPGFFLPVRVLSRLFRGKFLAGLSEAQRQGKLRLTGPQAALADPRAWAAWLRQAKGQDWVVYSQPPVAGAEVVLKYLARYTYRVAMSNSRLTDVSEEQVSFTYKDYRQQGKSKEMTLSLDEFARRFLQHILPGGFVRVRHYGLLTNRGRDEKLQKCRRLLWQAGVQQRLEAMLQPGQPGQPEQPERAGQRVCPLCGQGLMEVVEVLAAVPPVAKEQRPDSS